MAVPADRKLFLGARLRRLRRDLGLTQSRMADDLGVSPSYLNLLERNQRPVTAQVLLRLADAYDLDLRSLTADGEGGGAGLSEVFADPLFQDLGVSRHEVAEVAENSPGVAEAVVRLYQAFADRRRLAELVDPTGVEGPVAGSESTPSNSVRDFIQSHKNHFPELEERAEAIAAELSATGLDLDRALGERLSARFQIRVQVVPRDVLPDLTRRFDHHRKRLYLSELLNGPGRTFALAYHLALLECGEVLNKVVGRAGAPDRPTRSLLKVSLANYVAAALLMPYEAFRSAVEESGYDIDLVRARFGVSFEQACHRLTTLARPGARGVPFFMLRLDAAGNISKRFASAVFPFSRFGGTCPRWNIHSAFRTPRRILTQVVETPDGQRYFTLARTVERPATPYADEDTDLAIGLGCELKYAPKLVYARGLDLAAPRATPIGPACRICERQACPQRAAEPISRTLIVDELSKSVSPYPFAPG
ncbi:MAG TPA: short-chain fatty acyl-CoA regulator family protein [Caulobacteraceae bacterium]|jgi:predicted transcriptional regulator/transcriptional regulator with XRE-family HTH domain|nr:short-chain fatty acyl-CoA regulator family protein [Caulobacteraceae bacterium]